MNDSISRRIMFPLLLKLYGDNSLDILTKLDASQWLPRERILEIQLESLKKVLTHAYERVPFYTKRFQEHGLHPREIHSLDDLERYPILAKTDVTTRGEEMVACPRPLRLSTRTTSGTTGLSLSCLKDRTATSYMRASIFRSYGWFDVGVGAKQARFWSASLHAVDRLQQRIKDFMLNRRRYSVMTLSPDTFRQYREDLCSYRPTYIYGYASAISEFAAFLLKEGLAGPSSLRAVITTSEMLLPHQRQMIEEAFRCRCVNEYGCSETDIIAFECPLGTLHLMDETLYVEFVENGRKVAPETPGRLLVTELRNRAMPLVRYDIGDMGSYRTGMCGCGRGLGVMHAVYGRQNSFFRTRDGRYVYDNIFDFLIKSPHVNMFRVVLKSPEHLEITLVPTGNSVPAEALSEFSATIKAYTGEGMTIDYVFCGDIPRRESGKRNYFQSEVEGA